jgi:hypothetical protein
MALNHSSLRWFGTHALTSIPRGLPSSLIQHELIRSVLLGTLKRSGIASPVQRLVRSRFHRYLSPCFRLRIALAGVP